VAVRFLYLAGDLFDIALRFDTPVTYNPAGDLN
jgi:hypothetical protein